jgi:GTP-sensing pleiotropic transcriptional regulator CodY
MKNILLLILFNLFLCNAFYNIIFLPGSMVDTHIYKPLVNQIQNNLQENNIQTNIIYGTYFTDFNSYANKIYISHSFGGYVTLLQCLKNNEDAKGCILINSHFNQRYKMPYFPIKINKIKIPVLTILGLNDEYLPFDKSIDDFFVTYEEVINDKYFIVNNGTHLSSFNNYKEISTVANQITSFINEIYTNNYTNSNDIMYELNNKFYWNFDKTHNYYGENDFQKFLKSKPINLNHMYLEKNSVLYKTKNVNITDIISTNILNEFNMTVVFNQIHLQMDQNIDPKIRKLFVPLIIARWLTFAPTIKIIDNQTISMDLLIIPINKYIVYYKFPNKYNIYKNLINIIK